jgi:uncharacterized protein YeeX (DUF496 family)
MFENIEFNNTKHAVFEGNESFKARNSFEDVLDILEETREKLLMIEKMPELEKDVQDLNKQIENLEERLSTIRN